MSTASHSPVVAVERALSVPRARVRLLGGFELAGVHGAVALPGTVQRLVAMLALHGRLGRSRLAGSLWEDTTEARALACLRTAIWRANQAVPGLVLGSGDTVNLAEGTEVDVRRMVAWAHAVLEGSAAHGSGATVSEQGELLPGWDDEWVTPERERLRQLRLHVLEARAEQLLAEGCFGLALECALAALRADPLRESAHRAVIRIHLTEGNVAEARQAFARCAKVLASELAVAPSRQTTALVDPVTCA